MWLLGVLIFAALIIASLPLPAPPRHRRQKLNRLPMSTPPHAGRAAQSR
jgi:hypothetical protein